MRSAALLTLLLWPSGASAQGGRAGELFDFGVGGRALGMGGAHTAVVRDATSLSYNPAGLGLLPGREVAFMRARLFEGASYDHIAYAQNHRKRAGGWGVEMIRLGVGGADGRDEANNPTGDFDYSETALGFGAGWRGVLYPTLSAGFKAKLLRRSLGGSSDSHYGLDFGVQSGPWLDQRLTLGAVALNVLQLKKGDTDDRLRFSARVGASYRLVGPLHVAMDVSDAGELRVGSEYAFGMTALRVGFADQGISFGGGLTFRERYKVDLAIQNHPTLGMSQRLSLGYRFAARSKKEPKLDFYARELLSSAQAELQRRNYVKAARDFETAMGINPKIGGGEWGLKAERLRRLIKRAELESYPEDQEVLRQEGPAAYVAFQAVSAFLSNEPDRASLLAHAALGTDPQKAAYQRLLEAVSGLTGRRIERDEILPAPRLAQLKSKRALEAVYARKLEAGVEQMRQALWLDPRDALAWTRLGSMYFAMGDRVRAKVAYDKALELNPADDKLINFMRQQNLE